MYNIISSGSKGNAIVYHGSILVDCGVSFRTLKPYISQLQIVLLTHQHNDHLNLKTLSILQQERPTLRIGTPAYLLPLLPELNNIDVYEIGEIYNYGTFKISTVKAYHDVPNVGYRIFKGNHKTLHITDTAHLEGITAKDYDLYAIEHNYCEEKLNAEKENSIHTGVFSHAFGSEKTHLSKQQAETFIIANAKPTSQIIELHKSSTFF